jgi:DNA polymerase sigma
MRHVKPLPKARVPIVKFTDSVTYVLFWRNLIGFSGISCDICINNLLAPHNTKFLADYAKIDPRVQQLGYIVKYWAKKRQINEPYQGTLSSYAYILMVIHFLQQRNPPILPCLQQLHPEEPREILNIAGFDCWYYNKIERLKDFGKSNRENIGELLHAFFRLYACEFDWDNWVVSVRTGKYLTKAEKQWDKKVEDSRDNIYFTLEDPFEITHNLGRQVDEENLKVIRYEFERAHRLLTNNDNLKTVCRKFTENEDKL